MQRCNVCKGYVPFIGDGPINEVWCTCEYMAPAGVVYSVDLTKNELDLLRDLVRDAMTRVECTREYDFLYNTLNVDKYVK